jgi:hypothetical protein
MPSTTTCLNCGTIVTDKFCPHCGQKKEVKRLSWRTLTEEINYFFFIGDGGFYKTVRELAIHPGRLYKNYLDGKRKKYDEPLSFLLISITVFIVVYQVALVITHYQSINTATWLSNDPLTKAMINKYRTTIELIILPFTSFVTFIIIAHPRLNYVEVFSISFFAFSFLFILLSLEYIVCIILKLNFKTNAFDIVTISIYVAWSLYAFYTLYKNYSIPFLIARILVAWIGGIFLWFTLARFIVKLMLSWHLNAGQ